MSKGFEFGENGFLARGADDALARLAADETEQRRDESDFVAETQVQTVVRVDLHDFDFSGALAGNFLENGIGDLTWPAPRRQKRDEHRLL